MKIKVAEFLEEKQYGFRIGKGTRNATFVSRTIMKRSIEK